MTDLRTRVLGLLRPHVAGVARSTLASDIVAAAEICHAPDIERRDRADAALALKFAAVSVERDALRRVVQAVEAQLDYMDSLKIGLRRGSEFGDGLNAAIARVRHALTRPCRHCGKGPDEDGDHSCTCPHSDDGCPDHPALAAGVPSQPADDSDEFAADPTQNPVWDMLP